MTISEFQECLIILGALLIVNFGCFKLGGWVENRRIKREVSKIIATEKRITDEDTFQNF